MFPLYRYNNPPESSGIAWGTSEERASGRKALTFLTVVGDIQCHFPNYALGHTSSSEVVCQVSNPTKDSVESLTGHMTLCPEQSSSSTFLSSSLSPHAPVQAFAHPGVLFMREQGRGSTEVTPGPHVYVPSQRKPRYFPKTGTL